jgi:hypothetical protein
VTPHFTLLQALVTQVMTQLEHEQTDPLPAEPSPAINARIVRR